MKTKQLLLGFVLSACMLGGLFVNTNPDTIPIGLLVLPIVLLFAIGFFASALLLRLTGLFVDNLRKQHILSVCGGLIGVFWVIVQSSGGITAGDLILLVIISVIALFYVTKY